MRLRALLAAALLAGSACSRDRASAPPSTAQPAVQTAAPASAASVPPAAPAPTTLALGEPVTAPLVSLADIARQPSRYADKPVATSGRVTAVCRERGCWLELADASGSAHVRIHGHSFSVPRTAPGHTARVQARVIASKGSADECEEEANARDGGTGLARVELDATGVQID
jgi:hypothetical protein